MTSRDRRKTGDLQPPTSRVPSCSGHSNAPPGSRPIHTIHPRPVGISSEWVGRFRPPFGGPAQTAPIPVDPGETCDPQPEWVGANGISHPPGGSLNPARAYHLLHAEKATAIITTAFHHASLLEAIVFHTAVNSPLATMRPKNPYWISD